MNISIEKTMPVLMCNAKEVFTSVNVSWASSLQGYRVWRASDTEISIEVMYVKR